MMYIKTNIDFPGGSVVKKLPANAGDSGSVPGWEDPLEKEMATCPSILAWEIPWTEGLGRLQCLGLKKSQTQFSSYTTTTNHEKHTEEKFSLYNSTSGSLSTEILSEV